MMERWVKCLLVISGLAVCSVSLLLRRRRRRFIHAKQEPPTGLNIPDVLDSEPEIDGDITNYDGGDVDNITSTESAPEDEKPRGKYDAVILHTDDDRGIAKDLTEKVRLCSGCEHFKIGLIEEILPAHGKLRMLESIFDETRYLFVLVTNAYNMDTFNRYFAESGLTHALHGNQRRVIPLWTDTMTSRRPVELKALKGIQCKYLMASKATDTYKNLSLTSFKRLLSTDEYM